MNEKLRFTLLSYALIVLAAFMAGCDAEQSVLYTLYGNSQRGLGNTEQAIEAYNLALALDPALTEAYYNRGRAYDLTGDYEQAIRDFDKVIELNPNLTEAYRARGRSYRESGELERAIDDFDAAIALDPDFADAYAGRGLAYSRLGDLEQAIQDYDKAIELRPEDAEAYINRGEVYFRLEDYAEAIEDWTKVIELAPTEVPAEGLAVVYYLRGLALGTMGDLERAGADLDTAITSNPDYADAHYLRGLVYADTGNNEQAIQHLERYLALAPDAANRAEVEAMIAELQGQPLQPTGQPLIDLAELQERPILHVALEGAEGEEQFVLAATLTDGQRVGTYPALGAVWSPVGDEFAFFAGDDSGQSLYVMNLEGDAQALFTPEQNEQLIGWQPVWSPDGTQIAVISVLSGEAVGDNIYSVVIVDAQTGELSGKLPIPQGTLALPFHMSPPNKFRWSPNGQKILVSWEKAVVLDIENERSVPISEQHVVVEWTPDSDGVYYFTIANQDMPRDRALGGFYLRRLDEETPVELMDPQSLIMNGIKMHPGIHYALTALSPSGAALAFVGEAKTEPFFQWCVETK
jgi:tetratricopeptide (TPR) repeat protein